MGAPVKRDQRGMALLVSLLMLIMVMLLGASAAQLALQGEKGVRAGRDRAVAFQAAEDALADAERDIQGGSGSSRITSAESTAAFDDSCASGAAVVPGLYLRASGAAPVWQTVDLSGVEDGGACSVDYGAYTGAAMRTGQGFLPFRKPRYIIERMECHQPGQNAASDAAPQYCYRVTAIGFGARPGTEVVLQTVSRKVD